MHHYVPIVGILNRHKHTYLITKGTVVPSGVLTSWSLCFINYNLNVCWNTLKFEQETESLCCLKGNVQLGSFPQPQPPLQHLYEGVDSNGKHFLANIRRYNSAFQMTSFGCNETTMPGFNSSFRIQGQCTIVLVAQSLQQVRPKVLANLFY